MAILLISVGNVEAEGPSTEGIPERYGLAATLGNTYDPNNDARFFMLSGFVLYDYDQVWPHKAPENLRFKVEFSAGVETVKSEEYLIGSLGVFALYYLGDISGKRFRPYVEGGIGGIYTGFKEEGQGLRLNFNPQLGLGAEFVRDSGRVYFAGLRLHHISNAGFHEDNRGVNSIVLMLGRFF